MCPMYIYPAHSGIKDLGLVGAYRLAARTGDIAATLAAGAALFSARWADPVSLALLDFVEVSALVTGAITAAVPLDLDLVVARSFSVSDTGGTPIDLTGENQQDRKEFPPSLFTDMRIAAAAALTPGTRTPDALPIGRLQGYTGTAVGTQFFGQSDAAKTLYRRVEDDEYPIILGQNEGLLLRSPLIGPATGTFNLLVRIGWRELLQYGL